MFGVVLIGSALAWGQARGQSVGGPSQEELEAHLAAQRKQLDDPTIVSAQRARIALEMAATLDRAAQSAPDAEKRRQRWSEAVALIDEFNQKEPRHAQKAEFSFQAAVYVWAEAQSWSQQYELTPTDKQARGQSVVLLDGAILRLRGVPSNLGGTNGEVLNQNRRFRLAQALADRARFEPDKSATQGKERDEALALLEAPFAEPMLQGFAYLLRAELFTKQEQYEKAAGEVMRAAKVKPPPSPTEILEVKVAIAVGRKQFDEAVATIDGANVDEPQRSLLAVKTRLAERAEQPPGPRRTQAEADAFRRAQGLKATNAPEARLAVLALAKAMEQPEAGQKPEAWDVLAEGYLALGDSDRASSLEAQGAERAASQGRKELAATFLNRAGAILFQAGKYARADKYLSQVFDDKDAGPLRPRAGMLRILSRARGLAAGQAGCTREAFVEALTTQLRKFPDDPTAGEARWLLGTMRLGVGERDEAMTLWAAIPHSDPHWLQSRVALAQIYQEAVENQLINDDRNEVRRRIDEAKRFLGAGLAMAADATEKADLDLCRARLELTPGAAQPEEALAICDGLLKDAGLVEQRDRAQRLRIVALAQLGRFVDAERESRVVAARASSAELLTLARLLDHSASVSDSDLFRRRFGQLMRILLVRVLSRIGDLPSADRPEAQLRQARALLFSGSFDEARKILETWPGSSGAVPDGLLDDLADTYVRLDAFGLAIDVYRLRAQHSRPGTLPWFGARYGQALSYYRSGKNKEGRRLIDATAILHPDLGGGDLKSKFERLRQRLQQE
jgi:hypothetical protein